MSPRLPLLCLLAAMLATPALAVVVPDDYPTIQEAIDSGASVVQVRAGTYLQPVRIAGSVRIEALLDPNGSGRAPELGSLDIACGSAVSHSPRAFIAWRGRTHRNTPRASTSFG